MDLAQTGRRTRKHAQSHASCTTRNRFRCLFNVQRWSRKTVTLKQWTSIRFIAYHLVTGLFMYYLLIVTYVARSVLYLLLLLIQYFQKWFCGINKYVQCVILFLVLHLTYHSTNPFNRAYLIYFEYNRRQANYLDHELYHKMLSSVCLISR